MKLKSIYRTDKRLCIATIFYLLGLIMFLIRHDIRFVIIGSSIAGVVMLSKRKKKKEGVECESSNC